MARIQTYGAGLCAGGGGNKCIWQARKSIRSSLPTFKLPSWCRAVDSASQKAGRPQIQGQQLSNPLSQNQKKAQARMLFSVQWPGPTTTTQIIPLRWQIQLKNCTLPAPSKSGQSVKIPKAVSPKTVSTKKQNKKRVSRVSAQPSR